MDFIFLGEHFKTTRGALVVPGAVVGNHCLGGIISREIYYNVDLLNLFLKEGLPQKILALQRFLGHFIGYNGFFS